MGKKEYGTRIEILYVYFTNIPRKRETLYLFTNHYDINILVNSLLGRMEGLRQKQVEKELV